ncbi:PREDICTED: T-cell surface glycoprotein CD5 [Corvus brachyrhynchos]|uniref:T-cell surface glycoprotein CD5 n=1 Tax=Corvus brachyrhynchos TaxID=85066 RepID=UPI00081665EE|nr:PREDICTED: T-cell surface glycoprotein CD5 [Corvus brachyrhynchos]
MPGWASTPLQPRGARGPPTLPGHWIYSPPPFPRAVDILGFGGSCTPQVSQPFPLVLGGTRGGNGAFKRGPEVTSKNHRGRKNSRFLPGPPPSPAPGRAAEAAEPPEPPVPPIPPPEPMATRLPILCLLLGMWAVPDRGAATWIPREAPLRLTRGGCRCTGILEVNWENQWRQICWESVSVDDLDWICQRLEPLGCHWELENCTAHMIVSCREAVKTPPKPPPAPPATTPEPTGPPRLRLVDGNFSCSGFLELHKQGLWGRFPGDQLGASSVAWRAKPRGSEQAPSGPAWNAVGFGGFNGLGQLAEPASMLHFPWEEFEAPPCLALGDSQPRALRRLAAGPTPCEGDIQVFHAGRWRDLCDSGAARRAERGRQICRELGCGNLTSSTEIREPPSTGVTCGIGPLHLCQPKLGNIRSCSRTRVVCQDSKPLPAGTSAGTVVSICLALLLFLILVLICGPPAYRKLMKRISKKKQRQWIGPTGVNQTVSFHRSSTAPRPRGHGGDNDYAQPPPKSSQLSAYPALEAACRRSNPPDNSSDSDYDLHSARRV